MSLLLLSSLGIQKESYPIPRIEDNDQLNFRGYLMFWFETIMKVPMWIYFQSCIFRSWTSNQVLRAKITFEEATVSDISSSGEVSSQLPSWRGWWAWHWWWRPWWGSERRWWGRSSGRSAWCGHTLKTRRCPSRTRDTPRVGPMTSAPASRARVSSK